MNATTTATKTAALFAAIHTTWTSLHPVCDQIVQTNHQATTKGRVPGWAGRRACAAHVASYTATHLLGASIVLRSLGYRVPLPALLAGAGLNAITHYVIDRRKPLLKVARAVFRSGEYLDWGTVARPQADGRIEIDPGGGPGTALFEIDQASHHGIAVFASLLTAVLAARTQGSTPASVMVAATA